MGRVYRRGSGSGKQKAPRETALEVVEKPRLFKNGQIVAPAKSPEEA
jgi:hypothetical protein